MGGKNNSFQECRQAGTRASRQTDRAKEREPSKITELFPAFPSSVSFRLRTSSNKRARPVKVLSKCIVGSQLPTPYLTEPLNPRLSLVCCCNSMPQSVVVVVAVGWVVFCVLGVPPLLPTHFVRANLSTDPPRVRHLFCIRLHSFLCSPRPGYGKASSSQPMGCPSHVLDGFRHGFGLGFGLPGKAAGITCHYIPRIYTSSLHKQ